VGQSTQKINRFVLPAFPLIMFTNYPITIRLYKVASQREKQRLTANLLFHFGIYFQIFHQDIRTELMSKYQHKSLQDHIQLAGWVVASIVIELACKLRRHPTKSYDAT